MKINFKVVLSFIVFIIFASNSLYGANNSKVVSKVVTGLVCPESYGAMGDGIHDDTEAMQMVLDSLSNVGGGTMMLGRGSYLVRTLRLGAKTSIVGCGNGATVIKQKADVNECCLLVSPNSAALRIADLSILGNNRNDGIKIDVSTGIDGENHDYLYKNRVLPAQPYKWITIDNVCVYHFDTGLKIERWGWDINICNSTFSHNGTGVVMGCTDSSLYNCYIANNKRNGILVTGSNNKISNVKSIWNGMADAKNCAAIVVDGCRNQLVNCETQDNYCNGLIIYGQYNLLSNCMSNTDGYFAEPKQYNPSIEACGFRIKGLYNSFSNCSVTSYTDKFGAVFHSPIIVDESVVWYYPFIYEDIKVLIEKDKPLFHEPFRNVQILASKNVITSRGDVKNINCPLNSLNMLVDFKSIGTGGNILTLDGKKYLSVLVTNQSVDLLWQGETKAKLILDEDVVLDQDDIRLIVSFSQYGQQLLLSMLMYEKTSNRGWIKKEIRQETDIPSKTLKGVDLRVGDKGIKIQRIALSNIPMPESVYLPYSNTNKIYGAAFVYVDSDSQ